jgi:hypothetical protein
MALSACACAVSPAPATSFTSPPWCRTSRQRRSAYDPANGWCVRLDRAKQYTLPTIALEFELDIEGAALNKLIDVLLRSSDEQSETVKTASALTPS